MLLSESDADALAVPLCDAVLDADAPIVTDAVGELDSDAESVLVVLGVADAVPVGDGVEELVPVPLGDVEPLKVGVALGIGLPIAEDEFEDALLADAPLSDLVVTTPGVREAVPVDESVGDCDADAPSTTLTVGDAVCEDVGGISSGGEMVADELTVPLCGGDADPASVLLTVPDAIREGDGDGEGVSDVVSVGDDVAESEPPGAIPRPDPLGDTLGDTLGDSIGDSLVVPVDEGVEVKTVAGEGVRVGESVGVGVGPAAAADGLRELVCEPVTGGVAPRLGDEVAVKFSVNVAVIEGDATKLRVADNVGVAVELPVPLALGDCVG